MPNGIIKLLYSGPEDKIFTKNPSINYYKTIYKSYSNFVRIPENIEIEDNYNINTTNTLEILLNKFNYDLLGNMTLYFNLNHTIVNILDFITKIELYISDILIDSLTPDIINLYNEIYSDPNNYKNLDLLTKHNNKNTYYIPLDFHFLKKKSAYIPLYLLDKEIIYLKIYLNNSYQTDIIAHEINLIGNYFILDNETKKKLDRKFWLIETISYNENINLKVSIKADLLNKIELLFLQYVKSLIFVFKKCNFHNIHIHYNDNKVTYMNEELKYLPYLNTGLKNNHNYDDKQILLCNYSLFKKGLSGYINLDTITNFFIELYPFAVYRNIIFNITSVFSSNYFFITTDLITSEINQSPDISIYTNVKYQFTNINCDIIIVISNPESYINSNSNIPVNLYHPNFNYNEKTLMLDSENTYTELYYCHKIVNSGDILVNYGRLLVFTDDKANASTGLLNTYAINYDLYVIQEGKLFNSKFD